MDMETETWRAIPGLGGYYMASSWGRIKANVRVVTKRYRDGTVAVQNYSERVLQPKPGLGGYFRVHLSVDGIKSQHAVHRLVLAAFAGPCPEGMEGCHCNGDAGDNRPSNLRWDTHLANNRDRKAHGNYAEGERHRMSKLTEGQVRAIMADSRKLDDIAAEYSISKTHASRIKNGLCWTGVKGRRVRPQGYINRKIARGSQTGRAKLNENAVRLIRMDARGQRAIAKEFGITQSQVWSIKAGRSWAHVTHAEEMA